MKNQKIINILSFACRFGLHINISTLINSHIAIFTWLDGSPLHFKIVHNKFSLKNVVHVQ